MKSGIHKNVTFSSEVAKCAVDHGLTVIALYSELNPPAASDLAKRRQRRMRKFKPLRMMEVLNDLRLNGPADQYAFMKGFYRYSLSRYRIKRILGLAS
jgi:hypothetical protein